MSATHTQYGILALGKDPENWKFCENKYHNYFLPLNRETFERNVENYKPISVETLEENLQREQKTARSWKRMALAFAFAFLISCVSVILLWTKPPPEPIVYITRTGTKYHTHNCKVVEEFAVPDKYGISKYAIYLEKAQEGYAPCRICFPQRTGKSK